MKLLCFGATWCASCLIMRPRIKELEQEVPDIEVIYYDYDSNRDEVKRWNVKDTLPTFIFVDKDNKEITRMMGEKSIEVFKKIINEHKD